MLSSISCSLAVRSSVRRCQSVVLCSSELGELTEMVKDKESPVAFFRTEEDLLYGIRKEVDAGRLPSNIARGMEELYQNYRIAVFQSGNPKGDEIVITNMTVALDHIFKDLEDPFVFSPYHKAMREPFDYYEFGQNFIHPLIDFRFIKVEIP